MEKKIDTQNKTAKKAAGGNPAEATIKKRKPKQASLPKKMSAGQTDKLKRQLKIQKALFEIADAASAVKDMGSFYKQLHRIVGKLMYAENFFIALFDPHTDLITWPYNVDTVDVEPPQPTPLSEHPGITGWVIRYGKPLAVVDGSWDEVISRGEAQPVGTPSNGIAVPLRIGNNTIGVIMVQSYIDEIGYQLDDVKVLEFVAQHISTALTRARAIEETRQRNAELAVINSVQEGLAKQLDLQGIVDLIGEKVGEIFKADTVVAALYDAERDWSYNTYYMDHGERTYFPAGPAPRPSLGAVVVDSRRPLLLGTAQEGEKLGALKIASADATVDRNESYLGVPILAGEKVIGVIAVQSYKQDAYSDSDVRLLQTLANAMSVALQNAQSFKAEQERVAELQIINSIQQGLAAELDFQAIVDLVGDKLREVFKTPELLITWYDEKANLVHYLYFFEHGKRISAPSLSPLPGGIYETEIKTHQPLILNNEADYAKLSMETLPGTDPAKSMVSVPIISSDRFLGDISLENYDRENAFGESELRLLTTIAASLGTALENARLFNEVQKKNIEISEALEQQTATSEVLRAMSGFQPELRSLLETIAVNVAKVCGADDAHIYRIEDGALKEWTHRGPIPGLEAGESLPLNRGSVIGRAILDRQIVHIHDAQKELKETEYPVSLSLQRRWGYRTVLATPLLRDGEPIGGIAIRRQEVQPFTDKQIELIKTFADQAVIAIENVRLFDETQRLLKDTQQRNAELAIINSVQHGLASKLEFQAILELVGEKIRQIFDAQVVTIPIYDLQTGLTHYPYAIEMGKRIQVEPHSLSNLAKHLLKERQPVLLRGLEDYEAYGIDRIPGTEFVKSFLVVPLIIGDQVSGAISIQNLDRTDAFSSSDIRLLQTLAASLSVALENARLFDETQRLLKETEERNAELAVINAIQQGVGAELNFQAIIDLVGDKLREVLQTGDIGIRWYDYENEIVHYLYEFEHGERLTIAPGPSKLGWDVITSKREPTVRNTAKEVTEAGIVPGTDTAKSNIYISIIGSNRVLGSIVVENFEQEYAFSESEVRMLTTVASSIGIALENARLFDETQRLLKETEQRNAELAIINSVQQGLVEKNDMQSIYRLVGNKLLNVFPDTHNVLIFSIDAEKKIFHGHYGLQRSKKTIEFLEFEDHYAGKPYEDFHDRMANNRQVLIVNEDVRSFHVKNGLTFIPDVSDSLRSMMYAPLIVGDRLIGHINLNNTEREHAYGESEVRLVTTLVSSMSVALENARLFDETQRLLKETEQRAAELAIINSVQQGLASKLDMQAIYDLVGERIRDIFHTEVVYIAVRNPSDPDRIDFPYYVDRGQILKSTPLRLGEGLTSKVILERQPLLVGTFEEQIKLGAILEADERSNTYLGIPIIIGDFVAGVVSVQSYKENAFGESDIRLLITLASSMGVALENARLFDETQHLLKETRERAAELAIINSVQEGLAAQLDIQAIYNLIGDKIRDTFKVQVVTINSFDFESKQKIYHYNIEYGQHYPVDSRPMNSFDEFFIKSARPYLITKDLVEVTKSRFPDVVPFQGDLPKSFLAAPLIRDQKVLGYISLQNMEAEEAFGDSDVRLLSTLANSMSVALENARLFDETQRLLKETEERNAELAIINRVQQGLASKLDFQGIIDLVGDKIREIFDAQSIHIAHYDPEQDLFSTLYMIEGGVRHSYEPMNPGPIYRHLIDSREALLFNTLEEFKAMQALTIPGTGSSKSGIFVPLLQGNELIGVIALENIDRENAFSESDLRLLTTLTNSMSVALENAKLFDETQRLLEETEDRAAELAILNDLGEAMARTLDIKSVTRNVGDKVRAIFDAEIADILLYDPKSNMVHRTYSYSGGDFEDEPPWELGEGGLTSRIIISRKPLLLHSAQEMDEHGAVAYLTAPIDDPDPQSYLGVPIMVGERVLGVVDVQSFKPQAFDEDNLRLLQTLASNMGVALENARLFDETQRLLKETEQRAGELSAISTVSQALVAETQLDAMIELIGSQMREIFAADIVYIALLDKQSNLIRFPYQFGETYEPLKYGEGLTSKIVQTGEPLLINKDIEERRKELGTSLVGKEALSYLGVPIRSGKGTIGVLSVQSTTEEGAFDDGDRRLLATIAANAGAAIQTAQLHAETQRRAREMAILAEIGNDIAASRELEPVLERIASHAKDILRVRDVVITLREPDSNTFRTKVALGKYTEELRTVEITPNKGIIGHILESGVAEYVNDPSTDPRVYHVPGTPFDEDEKEYLMGAPLTSRGQIIGGIMVWREYPDSLFTQADLDFLVSVARQTAIAIESARLYLETQRRAREMSALVEVGHHISSSLDAETVLESIATHARDLLGGDLSALFLPEEDGSTFRVIAAVGKESEYLRNDTITLGAGILGSIAQNKLGEIVNDVKSDPRVIKITGTEISEDEHLLAVPLLANEELEGLMSVWRSGKGKEFIETELEFLIALSRQAVIAIQNTQLFAEAQHLLKETAQHAAELAIINRVQEGLASKLELQAVYDLVGDKIQGIFEAQVVGIYNFDHQTETIHYPYYREKGKRLHHEPRAFTPTAKYLIKAGQLLLINQDFEARMKELNLAITPLPDASNPKSVIYVPLLSSGLVIGAIGLKNVDREMAFSNSDVRLLQTLANSMSVALESARLFTEIESQRQYLEAIITNSPVAIITADLNGKVVSWNPAAEALFGYTPAEAIGKDTNDLIAMSDEIRAEALICSMQTRRGELFHSITRRNRKDGTLVDVDMAVVPVSIEKESMVIVGIYHNITELQRARQEAVAANEAKSSFLATMSHEIRTPMNAVIGMSGLLMDTALNKEQRDYAETIRNSSDALLGIINDILDFSKIEAGKMDLEQQPFNLRECIESALDLVAARAVDKNIDLAYIIEDDVPAGIDGDVTRLRQILLNLLSNAVKFTEQGEVVLTVSLDKEKSIQVDRETGTQVDQRRVSPVYVTTFLRFTVRDTGIGIPQGRIGQLFESFTQIDSSTTRKFGGTGLGLAISKRLVEMMGGSMSVESGGKDKGSTFSFTIRAKPAKVTERKQRNLEDVWPALEGKRALIVDDNHTNRRILVLQARKWGLKPRETKSARQALRWLKQGDLFDLAIFDLQMPEMDGIMLARETRKIMGGRSLPIILLTSLGRREAGIEDIEISAYLTKPIKPSALFDALAGIFVRQKKVEPRTESRKLTLDPEMAKQYPLRILLAEDNQVNQKLALRLLEQMGYRADIASNGLEAIESVQRQPYDVILMDVQMPEMDGLDATRAIRKLDIKQPYIVAMTANAMQGDRERCLAAGMEFYVSKPIRVPELVAALKLAKTDGR